MAGRSPSRRCIVLIIAGRLRERARRRRPHRADASPRSPSRPRAEPANEEGAGSRAGEEARSRRPKKDPKLELPRQCRCEAPRLDHHLRSADSVNLTVNTSYAPSEVTSTTG